MRAHSLFACLLLAGCGGSTTTTAADMAVPCEAPRTDCGTCVDLTSNASNCGVCGNRCKYGYVCQKSQCVLSCPDGLVACGTPAACVDTAHDANHCGTCDTVCPPGNSCVAGACKVSCQPGLDNCDGTCANLKTDPAHCGDCANPCPPGFLCSAGNCALTCQAQLTRCDLKSGPLCVNLMSDAAHCGDCALACPIGSACVGGQCMVACQNGLTNCNNTCVNLVTDNANCGKCGTPCPLGQGCVNGQCAGGCPMPLLTCKGACVDPRFDPNNCGGCDKTCVAANAMPGCVGSKCVVGACADGFADCDQVAGNGCEASIYTDLNNCLGCGNLCAPAHATPGCSQKGCAIAMCDANWVDCDQMAGNGCEVNTTADAANCGMCGNACPAVANGAPGCSASTCGVGSCKQGFADCDQMAGNGCETNLLGDPANCGGCARACPATPNTTPGCNAGKCQIGACSKGYADCDGQAANGCECNTAAGFACVAGACLPVSCNALKKAQPKYGDGVYSLAPDGVTAIQVWCDMTSGGGGWTLLLKLTGKDFCFASNNWTLQMPLNEMNTLDNTVPAAGTADAKSRAFYLMPDVTALRFVTTHGAAVTTFVSPSTPMNLMTTNNIPFAQYPDYTAWRAAFLQDRVGGPIFLRAGIAVTANYSCRTNPQSTPLGCGQLCQFCYLASDSGACGGAAAGNDVSSGVGLNATFCGGGIANCSSAGSWSDANQRTLVYGR